MAITFTQSAAQGLFISAQDDNAGGTWSDGSTTLTHTMALWIYPTDAHTSQTAYIADELNTNSAATDGWGCYFASGRVYGFVRQGGSNTATASGVALTLNTWNLVIVEREGDAIRLWVNGATTASDSATGVGTTPLPALVYKYLGLGKIGGSVRWKGRIAYFATYRGLLSLADKLRLWHHGEPGPYAALSLEILPVHYSLLNDTTPRTNYGWFWSVDTNGPTYEDNKDIFSAATDPSYLSTSIVTGISGIREFWDFQGADPTAHTGLVASTSLEYDATTAGGTKPADTTLVEAGDGIFGSKSLRHGSPTTDGGPLWVPGADAAHLRLRNNLTVMAWIKPFTSVAGNTIMGLIGGVWDEQGGASGNRQYALFTNLKDAPHPDVSAPSTRLVASQTVNMHTSDDGGTTSGYTFNYDVSYSGISMHPRAGWHCVAVTFKDGVSRSYVNGEFYPSLRNPYEPGYSLLNDSDAPFRAGLNIVSGGTAWGNAAKCFYGGLAVFARALTPYEIFMVSRGEAP